jgi:hypothetical protein
VKATGTGLIRIMSDYANNKIKPSFNVTDSSFMLTLPNMRFDTIEDNTQEMAVMKLIERDGIVTADSLGEYLNLKPTRCYNILKMMHLDGKILAIRNGRRLEYKLP